MYDKEIKIFFFFLFFILILDFFSVLPALGVGRQSWDTPPGATFDGNSTIKPSCLNYRSDIEAKIEGGASGKLLSGGASPVCSIPFNLLSVLLETFGGIEGGKKVWLCLSDGSATIDDCILYNDNSLVQTVYSPPTTKRKSTAEIEASSRERPSISIIFPKQGDFASLSPNILYSAFDIDDRRNPGFGLGNNAIDLYYSVDGENWVVLAEGQPNTGSFKWDTAGLPDGEYWIKAVVRDLGNEENQDIGGSFKLDTVPPLFDIFTDPQFTQGESVKVRVEATESLKEAPKVWVKQNNYFEVLVQTAGKDSVWGGVYEIRFGLDGPAQIRVEGKDLAGNESAVIRKGGSFAVGTKPPPAPVLISPLDNEIFQEKLVTIIGRVREDTKAVIEVNGEKQGVFFPDKGGNFRAENIELSVVPKTGVNIVRVFSEDARGNRSEASALSLKFNLPPQISVVGPREGGTVSGVNTLVIKAQDPNNDPLNFLVEISADSGNTWQNLIKDLKRPVFGWNTRKFADGTYFLRVTADDGIYKAAATSSEFLIKNFLPVISFLEPEIFTNKTEVLIRGAVGGSAKKGAATSTVASVEFSLDGVNWNQAIPTDGVFNDPREDFYINFIALKNKEYEVLVRSLDSQGERGEEKVKVVVDTVPPSTPEINAPADKAVAGGVEDLDPAQAGAQIKMRGRAEAGGRVMARIGEEVFEGRVDSKGDFQLAVTLRKHGENKISLLAADQAGNQSGAIERTLIFNNPPELKFLRPRVLGGLGGKAKIVFSIQDQDLDPVLESALYWRRKGEQKKKILVLNPKADEFTWNVSNFPQGEYELILEASDGLSRSEITRGVLVDNTPPSLKFEPLSKNVFRTSFVLEARGEAEDNFSGVEYVEYTFNEQEWFKALIREGFRERRASFLARHSSALKDGVYEVKFRATDAAGNISSVSSAGEIVVDTTPPRVGGFALSRGDISFFPEGEQFEMLEGTGADLTISLESDTKEAEVFMGEEKIPLTKDFNLWRGEFNFRQAGEYELRLAAEDVLGNRADSKYLGKILVKKRGRVISAGSGIEGVKLSVWLLNPATQERVLWNAAGLGLQNPILTGQDGGYQLLLPQGLYEIGLGKIGYQRVKSSKLEIAAPKFINFDFELPKREGARGFFEDILDRINISN